MRRSILMAFVLAAAICAIPAAASAATTGSAKVKPVAGTFQLVATSDYPLKGSEVKFTVNWSHGKQKANLGMFPNRGDGQPVVKITKIHPGDIIDVKIDPSSTSFGNTRHQKHVITASEAQLGGVMNIRLPYVQLEIPSI